MAKEIIFDKRFIMKIFELWYRIPEYQRPYVWESEQVTALLEDTFAAYQNNQDSQYFLGSMVLKINQRPIGSATYDEYELLDGQQRLTTIFLILAVIRDISTDPDIKDACKGAVFQKENIVQQRPERLRIVFDIRDSVKKFVDDYIKIDDGTKDINKLKARAQDKSADISVRNMAAALVVIREFLDQLSPTDLAAYFLFFWHKVLLTYVATQELHDAFQLFTVLNDRGVRLRNSDILKAMNLSHIQDITKRKNFAVAWEEMESFFGDDFDKFLSYVRTVLVKRKAETTLLKEFEENIYSNKIYDRSTKTYIPRKPLLDKGEKTFSYICAVFEIYRKIFELKDFNGDFKAMNYLTLMTVGLEADYWTAAVLSFCKKFGCDESETNYENFCKFLKLLDKKVSADWICSLSPAKRIENVNAVIKKIEETDSVQKVLSSAVFDIHLNDFERILWVDVYRKRYAKYLMLKLDLLYHGNNTSFQPPPTISIEHILPQNPPTNSQWLKDFSAAERDDWTDKLGNLILISRKKNSSLSNRDFAEKKKRYFEKNIELFSNSLRVFKDYTSWTPTEFKQNWETVEKKLLAAYKLKF